MLHAHNQDRLYLITPSEEQEALIDGLAVNVQDSGWLVYCALGAGRIGTGLRWMPRPESVCWTGASRRHDQERQRSRRMFSSLLAASCR